MRIFIHTPVYFKTTWTTIHKAFIQFSNCMILDAFYLVLKREKLFFFRRFKMFFFIWKLYDFQRFWFCVKNCMIFKIFNLVNCFCFHKNLQRKMNLTNVVKTKIMNCSKWQRILSRCFKIDKSFQCHSVFFSYLFSQYRLFASIIFQLHSFLSVNYSLWSASVFFVRSIIGEKRLYFYTSKFFFSVFVIHISEFFRFKNKAQKSSNKQSNEK